MVILIILSIDTKRPPCKLSKNSHLVYLFLLIEVIYSDLYFPRDVPYTVKIEIYGSENSLCVITSF